MHSERTLGTYYDTELVMGDIVAATRPCEDPGGVQKRTTVAGRFELIRGHGCCKYHRPRLDQLRRESKYEINVSRCSHRVV